MERKNSRFLAAMLGSRAGEDASCLHDQLPLQPETASSVEELPHLSAHVAKTGRGPEDYRVVVGEYLNCADGYMSKCLLRLYCSHFLQHVIREGFRYTL